MKKATVVSENITVLVLNSFHSEWKPALLIDSSGTQKELGCFSPDDRAEAFGSCSLVWANELYVYGGKSNKNQLSKLNQYRLQLVGSLPFDLYRGACTNMAGRKLFLCFDYYVEKQCHWSANPLGNFQKATLASYKHRKTRISSSKSKFRNLSQFVNVNFQRICWQSAAERIQTILKPKYTTTNQTLGKLWRIILMPERDHLRVWPSFLSDP